MTFKQLVELLKQKELTISSIESLTGGGFAYFITKEAGASSVFNKGLVTYSNEAKIDAGVDKDILKQFGAVSKEVALEMVNCLNETEIAVSFTGNAGPTAMDDKPVGRVYIGVRYLDETLINEYNFKGDRDSIRNQSLKAALTMIEKLVH